jgi:hypothetical protein
MVGNDKFAQSESCGPTGKRSAGKLACSVWSGGKAARPYLSLLKVILHHQFDLVGALAATDAQTVGPPPIQAHAPFIALHTSPHVPRQVCYNTPHRCGWYQWEYSV